ncbi:hypothetical protein HGRIS_002072 [Hohenbuehelia grisea]|uniref:F-box domain-containing protein n=1 Tax=Hohenbuehelia grisea TaxID=104357 RepID=A0ABR3JKF0_9AGAR
MSGYLNQPQTSIAPMKAPFSNLLPEILSDIYLLVYNDPVFPYHQTRRRSEVVFSHVSAHWRAVALSSPFLWRRVGIRSLFTLDQASKYLQRSKGCSIFVDIDLYYAEKHLNDIIALEHGIREMMFLLLVHLDRWISLEIETYSTYALQKTMSFLRNLTVPRLERLRLNCDDARNPPTGTALGPALGPFPGKFPLLRIVKVQTVTVPWPSLSGVTNVVVNIAHLTPRRFHLVPALSTLVALSIHTDTSLSFDGLQQEIELPCLETLHLQAWHMHLLLRLSMPHLISLCLDAPSSQSDLLEDPRPPLFPKLRYLTLAIDELSVCPELMYHAPNIEGLHLAFCSRGLWDYRHNPRLSHPLLDEPSAMCWGQLTCMVVRTISDSYELRDDIPELFTIYHEAGLPLNRLLVDREVYSMLGPLLPWMSVAILDSNNYEDPWWKMVQRDY